MQWRSGLRLRTGVRAARADIQSALWEAALTPLAFRILVDAAHRSVATSCSKVHRVRQIGLIPIACHSLYIECLVLLLSSVYQRFRFGHHRHRAPRAMSFRGINRG